jgi:four helix bundle protein
MGRIQGDLKERTLDFAVAILNAADQLPNGNKGWEIGRQLVRSGTSIGANIREADTAFTDADFAYRCNVSRKEASETHYWLQLCERAGLLPHEELARLTREANELVRILSTVVKATQHHIRQQRETR